MLLYGTENLKPTIAIHLSSINYVETPYPRHTWSEIDILLKQRSNSEYYRNTVCVLAPKLFNKLLDAVKNM